MQLKFTIYQSRIRNAEFGKFHIGHPAVKTIIQNTVSVEFSMEAQYVSYNAIVLEM